MTIFALSLTMHTVACGTSVSPTDADASLDAVTTADARPSEDGGARADSAPSTDVVLVEPTSLIRVTRDDRAGPQPPHAEVWAWLSPPAIDANSLVDRDMGECFYRRAAAPAVYYVDGRARWRDRTNDRPLSPLLADGPLVDSVDGPLPQAGERVEVTLEGSLFPSFTVGAVMPEALRLTAPAADGLVPFPTASAPLIVEWQVPSNPASVRIGVNWNSRENVYCTVPASRGRFVMDDSVVALFRDATNPQLVIGHVSIDRVVVGNRSLRLVVERLARVARLSR